MSQSMQENQNLVEIIWLPIPKKTFWRRRLAALGRRLTKRLRIRILYNDLKGGQEYSRM